MTDPAQPKLPPEDYLGDGVYASFDGYHIWLDTRAQIPINRIALEPSVLAALNRYAKTVDAFYEERTTAAPTTAANAAKECL